MGLQKRVVEQIDIRCASPVLDFIERYPGRIEQQERLRALNATRQRATQRPEPSKVSKKSGSAS